jgi:hypothetical protein
MHAKGKVGGKRPWRRRPRQKRRFWIVYERERDGHCKRNAQRSLKRKRRLVMNDPTRRVVDLLIILSSLKVRQRREQARRVGHDLETAIDEAPVKELLERPPDALHEAKIERLVVVVKVDPAAHALDGGPPLGRVAHDDRAALGVVFVDAHREHVRARRDAELLVDLVLDGHAVRVPAETARHVEARDVRVARDDVLQLCRGDAHPRVRTQKRRPEVIDGGEPLHTLIVPARR